MLCFFLFVLCYLLTTILDVYTYINHEKHTDNRLSKIFFSSVFFSTSNVTSLILAYFSFIHKRKEEKEEEISVKNVNEIDSHYSIWKWQITVDCVFLSLSLFLSLAVSWNDMRAFLCMSLFISKWSTRETKENVHCYFCINPRSATQIPWRDALLNSE